MPDLTENLDRLEALREGAAFPPWALREDQVYSWPSWKLLSRVGNCLHVGGTFPEKADAEFIVALVNASPWLIPLARQAETLAETIERRECWCEGGVCWRCKALAAYQAIVKEAENG